MSGPDPNAPHFGKWGEQWERDHSGNWRDQGRTMGGKPTLKLAPRGHSAQVVLDLERQINGGEQLSELLPITPESRT